MALSIPGGRSLLNDSLVYFSASLQITKLVSSGTYSLHLFKLILGLPGEYEETISRSFVRSTALKSLIHKTGAPEVIQNCESMFRKFVNSQIRDTLLTDMMSLSATEALDSTDDQDLLPPAQLKSVSSLPNPLKDSIQRHFGSLPASASILSHLTIAGITYSVASKHIGNSYVLLNSTSQAIFLPVQIQYIVQLIFKGEISTFIVAQRFKQHNTQFDPFSHYPLLQTQLWSSELGTLELHPIEDIQCHFACSTMLWEGKKVLVVVSLSRVCFHSIPFRLYLSFPKEFK
jgi:hypothetical protein